MIVAAAFFSYIRGGWTIFTEYMLATAPQGNPPPFFSPSSFQSFCTFTYYCHRQPLNQIGILDDCYERSPMQPVSIVAEALPIGTAEQLSPIFLQDGVCNLRALRHLSCCRQIF
jgi:hypothetical protein